MDKVTIGSFAMTWDIGSRLAFIRFEHETQATGRDGRGKLGSVDAKHWSVWSKFFPNIVKIPT